MAVLYDEDQPTDAEIQKCLADTAHPEAHVSIDEDTTLVHTGNGYRTASASMAFRLARLVGVGIDELLAGKWPAIGTCPRCGYVDKRAEK